tara:strand:- start:320 stop:1522 length:1203 start_codon:yes stop_codon:yes gene_type:complete
MHSIEPYAVSVNNAEAWQSFMHGTITAFDGNTRSASDLASATWNQNSSDEAAETMANPGVAFDHLPPFFPVQLLTLWHPEQRHNENVTYYSMEKEEYFPSWTPFCEGENIREGTTPSDLKEVQESRRQQESFDIPWTNQDIVRLQKQDNELQPGVWSVEAESHAVSEHSRKCQTPAQGIEFSENALGGIYSVANELRQARDDLSTNPWPKGISASTSPQPFKNVKDGHDKTTYTSVRSQSRTTFFMSNQTPKDDTGLMSARNHALYQRLPDERGLYYCAFPPCSHKPTHQRCMYHKYIDSHLKPFRCHKGDCSELSQSFSSSACLLRHEREAHGMHGHKPHLCHFIKCERAKKGFGRRCKLNDHIQRVHKVILNQMSSGPEQRKRKANTRKGGEKRQATR